MILSRAYVYSDPEGGDRYLVVMGRADNGAKFTTSRLLPAGWGTLTRAEKIAIGRDMAAIHLAGTNYILGEEELVYPDAGRVNEAHEALRQEPGWSDWTPAEAEAWVEDNVTDLASVKTALKKIAKAILYLRNTIIQE